MKVFEDFWQGGEVWVGKQPLPVGPWSQTFTGGWPRSIGESRDWSFSICFSLLIGCITVDSSLSKFPSAIIPAELSLSSALIQITISGSSPPCDSN
jgi:hypothetical protein